MKKYILALLTCFPFIVKAQLPIVTECLQELHKDTLLKFGNELTGKLPVVINGDTVFIKSRNANAPGNIVAKNYLRQKLKNYSLNPIEQNFDFTGNNIYALQKGTTDPKKYWIICAHYDDKSLEGSPAGADDNASGTAAVLEIARVLSTKAFPYTIIYAFWDNEEQSLDGSRYFVENNPVDFDHIQGVINLDMIGWDKDSDYVFDLHVRDVGNSIGIGQNIVKINKDYNLGLVPNTVMPGNGSSDQAAFWQGRIPAVAFYESNNDFNPHYHRLSDSVYFLNKDYWYSLTKLACASIAEFAHNETPTIILEESTIEYKIGVGPNPFYEIINLDFSIVHTITGKIKLYDNLGRIVAEEKITSSDDRKISVNNLSEGFYICRVEGVTKEGKYINEVYKLFHIK